MSVDLAVEFALTFLVGLAFGCLIGLVILGVLLLAPALAERWRRVEKSEALDQ